MPRTSGPTRATPLALLAIAGVLLAARIASGIWEGVHPESRPELVEWVAPSAAVEEARSHGRLVLYAFLDRSDPGSRKLSSEVFAEAGTATQLKGSFVAVRIEGRPAHDSPEIAALRERFQVTQLPTLVVSTPDGGRHRAIPGYESRRATIEQLTKARLELLGLPFPGRSGIQFRVGGRHGGAPDSSDAEGDSLEPADGPRIR